MHANATLLNEFYSAFAKRDHATMAAAYADDARFSDPVFPDLEGPRIGAMWRMLCTRGKDLELAFHGIEADDERGRAHWDARYTFSATGRKVHNVIAASFVFRDGKIVEHHDVFDFYRWSRMALGPAGTLLGWTPLVKNKVRRQAGAELERFAGAPE